MLLLAEFRAEPKPFPAFDRVSRFNATDPSRSTHRIRRAGLKENDMTQDDKDTINNEIDTADAAKNPASDSNDELTEAELDQVAGGEKVQFGSSS
jgi:hypothetical protein